jgi:ribosomal protein L24E
MPDSTEGPKCPFCKFQNKDILYGYDDAEGEGVVTCEKCKKKVYFQRYPTQITWTTSKEFRSLEDVS